MKRPVHWRDSDGDATHTLKPRGIPTTLPVDRQGGSARIEGAVNWAAADSVAPTRYRRHRGNVLRHSNFLNLARVGISLPIAEIYEFTMPPGKEA